MMSPTRVLPLLLLLSAPAFAQSGYRGPYQENLSYGYAQVLRVQPAYESYSSSSEPRCIERRHGNTSGGTVLGAIVGGALGNQVGKGDGRKAATVAGAVIGGTIGANKGRDSNDYEYRDHGGTIRRCRTVYDNNNSSRYGDYDAYKVTYRYAGQTYRTTTTYRPGRTIRVAVSVSPL